MIRFLLACTLLSLVSLVGCTTSPSISQDHLIDPVAARQLGYSLLWATDTQASSRVEVSYTVLDDLLVILEPEHQSVTAVSLGDGAIRWRSQVGSRAETLIAAVRLNDNIFVNTDGRMYQLSAETGKVLGYSSLEEPVSNGPALFDDNAIFGGIRNKVFAHSLSAGRSIWTYSMSSRVSTRPVLYGLGVFAADENGVMAMFTASTGTVLWRRQPASGVNNQPVVTSLGLFVPTDDNKLYSLNRATGNDRWIFRASMPLPQGPTAIGNTIYQPLSADEWVAIDATSSTGTELYRVKGRYHSVLRVPAGTVWASANQLTLTDPLTGKLISQTPTQTLRTILTGPDNSLILVSPQGRLLRLDPRN